MNSSFTIILILLIIFWITNDRKKRKIVATLQQIISRKKTNKENKEMKELAKQFIGEECIIYTITSTVLKGTLKEVTDEGLLLQRSDSLEAVNFDYVISIRNWPRDKKGKKKQIFE